MVRLFRDVSCSIFILVYEIIFKPIDVVYIYLFSFSIIIDIVTSEIRDQCVVVVWARSRMIAV